MFDHKNLLSIDELSAEDIMTVLTYAKTFEEVNERPIKKVPALRGKTICNLFLEPSTRTRGSFELAEKRLSCDTINAGGSASSTVKGESLVDTVKTLDSMKVDMFVVRHKYAGTPYMVSQHTNAAAIDAGDGKHQHPTQALLDLYTIWKEKGSFEGLKVGIVGDIALARGPVRSFLHLRSSALKLTRSHLPPCCQQRLKRSVLRVYANLMKRYPSSMWSTCCAFRWNASKRAPFPSLREYNLLYGLTKEREELMKPDAIICHPGPINRGVELDSYMADGSRSVITDQVFSGVCVRMALIYLLLGGANDGLSV